MKATMIVAGLYVLAAGSSIAQVQVEYRKASDGERMLRAERGAVFKVLVEESVLGSSDVEVAEVTFPGDAYSVENMPGHRHDSIEILYVLEGRLEHIVNGERYVLTPGMVGIVRPQDLVVHRVAGGEAVRALVIWAPGGELEGLPDAPPEKE